MVKKEIEGKRTFTCPNPSCKKVFNTPLKVSNVNLDSAEPYVACPYCLTKITEAQIETHNKPEKVYVEKIRPEDKPNRNKEIPPSCNYHLGHLSEQKHKEQIPDECIVCRDIIECMLGKTST